MYNWRGHSRELVLEVLNLQTGLFQQSDRSEGDLAKIKREISGKRPAPRYARIHNCEFLGFIDRDFKKVGCLLHPELNQEKKLRDLSFHGRATCDEIRCTAYFYLSASEAELAAKATCDWYLYGLCLTDLDLSKEFFEIASDIIFEDVNAEKILKRPKLIGIFRKYVGFKERWPFARNPNRFGKYYFVNSEYPIYKIDYQSLASEPSKYDKILNSLASEFRSRSELVSAEQELDSIFSDFAEAWRG